MVIFHFQGPLPTTDAGHKYVLTITDYYTKFVDFYPLKEKAAIGVARRIKTFVFRYHLTHFICLKSKLFAKLLVNFEVIRLILIPSKFAVFH